MSTTLAVQCPACGFVGTDNYDTHEVVESSEPNCLGNTTCGKCAVKFRVWLRVELVQCPAVWRAGLVDRGLVPDGARCSLLPGHLGSHQ